MDVELNEIEVRVLGTLVEKDLSTPEYYPMTLSALTAACNQKTNRDPVVSYGEQQVAEALESLQRKHLAGTSTSSHGRAVRYRHALAEAMKLERRDMAALAILMLRGPRTAGEVRGRGSRMYAFDTLNEVDEVLQRLEGGEDPLVVRLERRPGQKEDRFAHCFGGVPEPSGEEYPPNDRLEDLQERVAVLERQLETLQRELTAFRRQFE